MFTIIKILDLVVNLIIIYLTELISGCTFVSNHALDRCPDFYCRCPFNSDQNGLECGFGALIYWAYYHISAWQYNVGSVVSTIVITDCQSAIWNNFSILNFKGYRNLNAIYSILYHQLSIVRISIALQSRDLTSLFEKYQNTYDAQHII